MTPGRALGGEDDSRWGAPAIVLSYSYWQRAFGGDRAAIGRTVRLNNTPVIIAGGAEAEFNSLTPGKTEDFFLPLSLADPVKSEGGGRAHTYQDPAQFIAFALSRL